jgi:acyl-CoA synthetase (AMP-forming)/AMP-acid ligase II
MPISSMSMMSLPEDAAVYAAPLSHGAGLYNFMHVLRGSRHVIPASGGFDARELSELAPRLGSVTMFAAPTMISRWVSAARQSGYAGEGVRTIVYGGGPMYLADIEAATAQFGARFVQIYGQGECPMAITSLSRANIMDRESIRAGANGWRRWEPHNPASRCGWSGRTARTCPWARSARSSPPARR